MREREREKLLSSNGPSKESSFFGKCRPCEMKRE